jgi:hypothetical protein
MGPVARGVAVFVMLASLSVVEACGADTTANDDSPGKTATSAPRHRTPQRGRGNRRRLPSCPFRPISQ